MGIISMNKRQRNIRATIVACAAALLVAVPAAALAQQKGDAAPVVPAKLDTTPKEQPAQPAAKPEAAPAAKPEAAPPPGPVAPPQDIVIRRTEVYGTMVSKVGKVATFISLVSTSSEPLPVGVKGILYRKVEKPGDPAGAVWLEVAEVTFKKVDAAGKMQLTVVTEKTDALVNGKKANHFQRGTKIKLQVDQPG